MRKIKNIISNIIAITLAFSVVVFVIYAIVQCSNERDNSINYELKYGIEHPTYYEISFINGHKDTITVWTDPEYGDCIKMYDNGGTFSKGYIVLSYIPYKMNSYQPISFNCKEMIYYHFSYSIGLINKI